MGKREAFEEAFTVRGETKQDFAGAVRLAGADEQSVGFEAALQSDCAVVADLQALGESADGRQA